MKLIKKLFGKKEDKNIFSLEYYPITDRYYPKYKNYYLKTNYYTGIVETKEYYLFPYAEYSKTKHGAEEIIEKFKEQILKENVKTINL